MNSLPGRGLSSLNLISRGVPATIITLLFLLSAFLINTRPFGLGKLKEITGGAGIPDMEFFYTPASLSSILDALGPAGREFYLTRIIPLDMVFPLFYSLFFLIVLFRLMGALGILNTGVVYLLTLPVLAGSADYAENFCFLSLLLKYPEPMNGLAVMASLFTLVKWICTPASFLLILVMAVLFVKNRIVPSRSGV